MKSDNTELIDMLSIPKLELDKFDGNPLEYHSFINVFDENVGNKTSDDRVKFTRLLQYTTGSAKAAIRNCSGSLEPEYSCHDRDWIMELPMEADILTFTGILTPEDASVASCSPLISRSA